MSQGNYEAKICITRQTHYGINNKFRVRFGVKQTCRVRVKSALKQLGRIREQFWIETKVKSSSHRNSETNCNSASQVIMKQNA